MHFDAYNEHRRPHRFETVLFQAEGKHMVGEYNGRRGPRLQQAKVTRLVPSGPAPMGAWAEVYLVNPKDLMGKLHFLRDDG